MSVHPKHSMRKCCIVATNKSQDHNFSKGLKTMSSFKMIPLQFKWFIIAESMILSLAKDPVKKLCHYLIGKEHNVI